MQIKKVIKLSSWSKSKEMRKVNVSEWEMKKPAAIR